MEQSKAELLNKKASNPESKSIEIINSLEIQEAQTIADIGSGGGYFAFLFAEKIGNNGQIFCVDTNKDLLDFIDNQILEKQISNIKTIHYYGKNLPIEPNSLDLIFIRNVTHHLKNRTDYFKNLTKFLKQNGKIAVIDYKKGELFSFHGIMGHYVHKKDIIFEMKNAGFEVEQEFDFLEKQHFTIFTT